MVGADPWAAMVFPLLASRPKGPLLQHDTPSARLKRLLLVLRGGSFE